MIVLDTNVLSEIMRPAGERSATVRDWLLRYQSRTVYTAAPAYSEVLVGVERLAPGRRRSSLAEAAEAVAIAFDGRILPFDERAARVFAEINGQRRSRGLATPTIDLQIAAIARVAGMAVATRNVTDFQECGVEVIDPWTA